MLERILGHCARVLLPAALLPTLSSGQATVGLGLTQVLSSGKGVARNCLQPEYSTGLGLRLSVPVLTRWSAVQVSGRGYWLERGPDCVDGFPPPPGTYVEEDRVDLLSGSFATTDVRLAAQLADNVAHLAFGGGNAWHEGHNLPYVVLAGGAAVLNRPSVRVSLDVEYQWLRVTSDRFQRTYDDFGLVAEEPLGRVREWSHAFIIGIAVDIPLREMNAREARRLSRSRLEANLRLRGRVAGLVPERPG